MENDNKSSPQNQDVNSLSTEKVIHPHSHPPQMTLQIRCKCLLRALMKAKNINYQKTKPPQLTLRRF